MAGLDKHTLAEMKRPVPDWTPPPWPGKTPITGRYTALEALDADAHAADLFRAVSEDREDRMWDFMPYGPFHSAAAYHRWAREITANPDPHFYAIRDLATGHVGGVASFLRIRPGAGSIELGHIHLAPELQQNRVASEAFTLMIGWAFDAGYRRFEWKCDAANLASRRAAQRLGLSYEGVFRQHLVVKGLNRDTAWFAAIDSEWPGLKEAYRLWLDPANFDAEGRQIERLSDLTRLIRAADDPALAG